MLRQESVDFDVIVIGAGHAGLEAALASARLGFKVGFVSQDFGAVARMSCNPAIGGLAKGNMVREIDALGGEMGLLADSAMLQFRILNASKGAAVQAPRAQEDKYVYSENAFKVVASEGNITRIKGTAVDFLIENGRLSGVVADCGVMSSRAVVLTTGTFMEARTFTGDTVKPEGRIGEPAAVGLGSAMRRLGFNMGRLKTGTPARIRRDSIDYGECGVQKGDDFIIPFSFMNDPIGDRSVIDAQEPCYITFTNVETHRIIRENFHRSPLFSGLIVGRGPRYCPSIEDKVKRFPDRDRHQIFIEPEGRGSETMYLNGLSSSLPRDVQDKFVRTIPGLTHCDIVRYAYAVEYDYSDPRDLKPSLESKVLENLFIAGQTNGTSGYEEAAGQGLLAGINASLKLLGRPPLVLGRDESYIGVLVDDLVTRGTSEPYRMFTSRAEYRLSLRHDTADRRLTPRAMEIGLADEARRAAFGQKLRDIAEVSELLKSARGRILSQEHSGGKPDVASFGVSGLERFGSVVIGTVLNDIRYSGYVKRQESSVRLFRRLEGVKIPDGFDYASVVGLSAESFEKLNRIRPESLRQASAISGIRQSDLALLSLVLSGKVRGAGESSRSGS